MARERPPTIGDLVRYVELQSPGASSLDRIPVAESLSYDLGLMADRLTDHFVQQARQAGHSWTEIGHKLGMTKQGAQQRHTIPAAETDEALISEMLALDLPAQNDPGRKDAVRKTLKKVRQALHFQRFTTAARQVVVQAQKEARDLRHAYIAPEHLLLAILSLPDEVGGRALSELGVSTDAGRAAILEHLRPGTASAPGHIPFTKESKKALELSLRESIRLGHDYIGTEHVLLGLVRGKKGAVELLEKMGVTAEQVVDQVDRMLQAA
jgi:hypothetical protein